MQTTRIEAELMIPGRGEPVRRGTVVLEDGLITYAGDAGAAPVMDDALVVEVPTVMPGLWECHGHFNGMRQPDIGTLVVEDAALLAARATTDVLHTLEGGVTSVREMGGIGVHLRKAIEEGSIRGPRIYPAGKILSQTGGHADVHGLPLDWVAASETGLGRLCDGVDDCRRAVREQLRAGADVIKICASGGVMSEIDDPLHQQFSDEELATIVAEAARWDRVVAAHCHGKPGIMAALRAGVRTIEHGTYLDEEAADLMKANGAILVATRMVVDELLAAADALPAYALDKLVSIVDQHAAAMRIAIEAGVTLAAGTDQFLSGRGYGRNGTEIRLLIEAGADPLVAVEAATANGPLTLGNRAPRSGRLAAGHDADVIALDGDPLADPAIWGSPERVTHVWKGGEITKAPALR